MREPGRREAERLVEQNLTRRIRQMILAPDHLRHLHQGIVDHHREVVRGCAVAAKDDRIADDVPRESHLAADDIREHDVASLRYPEADGRLLAAIDPRLRLLERDLAA